MLSSAALAGWSGCLVEEIAHIAPHIKMLSAVTASGYATGAPNRAVKPSPVLGVRVSS